MLRPPVVGLFLGKSVPTPASASPDFCVEWIVPGAPFWRLFLGFWNGTLGTTVRRGRGDGPAASGLPYVSSLFEGEKDTTEPLVINTQFIPKRGSSHRRFVENGENPLVECESVSNVWCDDLSPNLEVSGRTILARTQLQRHRGRWFGGAVFQGQYELVSLACEVGITIPEGVKVAASSECLSWLCSVLLARMVDQGDGRVESTLKVSEVTQKYRHICRAIFICAVESD